MTQAGSGRGGAVRCDADGHGVTIFTDGGCRRNPGLGAWAAVILSEGDRQEICGVESRTTNNRMELTAAIEALRTLEPGRVVTVITDSNYLRRGVTEWMSRWIARGWKTADKKPVLNRDLWEQLNDVVRQQDIEWKWVRGHSGEPENERCDELVNEAMDKYE